MVALDQVQAGLWRRILHLAWPAILEMVLHMMVGIVDTAMVGRLGAEELAAVGLGSRILFSTIFTFAALGTGGAALVARSIGAKDPEGANRIAAQALVLGLLAGGIVALAGFYLANYIFTWVRVEPQVAIMGRKYLRITMLAGVFMLPLFIANAVLRGAGNTRAPLVVALIANGVNIIGDYLLIFGLAGFPALGVAGAAVATALSQVLGCFLTLGILLRGNVDLHLRPHNFFCYDREIMRRILRLSIPAVLEESVLTISSLIFIFMVTSLGTVAFAAHQVANSVESLSFMPGHGFAIATATIVGQKLGGQSPAEANDGGQQGTLMALMAMGAMGLLFFTFPRQLVYLFAPGEAQVISLGARAIRIGALEQPCIAATMVLSGALRGAGETRYPLYVTLLGNWLVRMPLTYLVIYVWRLSLGAVWIVTVLDWLFRGSLLYRYYRRGKWLTVKA
ncbi:MAG: MATE family efflux transporter [Firmicutes bacterium]|nr:MATE family efflux transporter [Bacillota bacterium]